MSEASSEKTNTPFGVEFLEDLEIVTCGLETGIRTLESATNVGGGPIGAPPMCDK